MTLIIFNSKLILYVSKMSHFLVVITLTLKKETYMKNILTLTLFLVLASTIVANTSELDKY
jgi:hypothetical protein